MSIQKWSIKNSRFLGEESPASHRCVNSNQDEDSFIDFNGKATN